MPSGRRAGSSSSSQLDRRGHRRAGRGPRAVRRDQRLVVHVLGVVQPGPAAPLADVPLPADQVGHDRADGLGQLLHPGPGVREAGPAGHRDPDLQAARGRSAWAARARPGAPGRCGAAGPAPGRPPRTWPRRGRCRSARSPACPAGRSARSRRATPARRSWPPRPARPARPRPGRCWSSPGSASGSFQRGSQSGAWSGSCLCQNPAVLRAAGEAVHVQRPVGQVGQRSTGAICAA